ncbi:MAG: dimethylarginine dimethylaminohydrolase [Microbacteriaceae bacterium]|nr:MAG: dimethylarginine dimethylaminohydrolase [Microbacteriaceae bacterium]
MTYSWGRRLAASALSALAVGVTVHVVNLLAFFIQGGFQLSTLGQVHSYFTISAIAVALLVFVLGVIGWLTSWWKALLGGIVVGIIAPLVGSLTQVLSAGTAFSGALILAMLSSLLSVNLIFMLATIVTTVTLGRLVYRAAYDYRGSSSGKFALVRIPAANLADGLVTHIERTAVDPVVADEQWDAYVAALVADGWQTVEVAPAETLPDSVFVEDAAVVFGETAIVTNSGAPERRPEAASVEVSLREQGLKIEHITEPGTLDGGDVLKVGSTVYVGRGGRTNAEGVRQLRALVAPLGYTVIAVPVTKALHLKSAVTALPDGTIIGHPDTVDDPALFDRFLAVPEPAGAHVVVLGPDAVLMAASAPQSAALIADLGYRVVTVDISEFEKLEGCVTCLSIRVR